MTPPTPPAAPTPSPEVSLFEAVEVLAEAAANQQRAQVFSPTPMPMAPPRTRRRNTGCCSCGCLWTLFALVIAVITLGAVGLGVYASKDPAGVSNLLADPGKAINSLLQQIQSSQASPLFTSYVAPASSVRSGASATVRWSTNGADVQLQRLNSAGALIQSISVPSSGAYALSVTGSPGESVTYRLVASLGGQSVSRQFTITVR